LKWYLCNEVEKIEINLKKNSFFKHCILTQHFVENSNSEVSDQKRNYYRNKEVTYYCNAWN